jgi:hypothetical protein
MSSVSIFQRLATPLSGRRIGCDGYNITWVGQIMWKLAVRFFVGVAIAVIPRGAQASPAYRRRPPRLIRWSRRSAGTTQT